MIFNLFFIGILTIFITIFTMAQLDLTMMLLVVVLTPISLFISRFIAKKSYSLFRQQTKARGEQADFIEENIQQADIRSEEHTSELQSRFDIVCRLLLAK